MKKISFFCQKGGVGKTTVAGAVAVYLARKGYKVCLVDCDSGQGNLTTWLSGEIEFEFDLLDVLLKKAPIEKGVQKIEDNLWIFPCLPLSSDLRGSLDATLTKYPFFFKRFCQDLEKLSFNFDLVFFDLNPASALLEERILIAVDEVIAPLSPEFFSLDGVTILQNKLNILREEFEVELKFDKIVCNLINKSFSRHNSFVDTMTKKGFSVFKIGQDSQIANAQYASKTVFDFAPKSKSIPEISRIGDALCQK